MNPRLFAMTCLFVLLACPFVAGKGRQRKVVFITADNRNIQYTGRIDFSNPKQPKFWSPGVYIQAKFRGPSCEIVINDEVLGGNSHNYLEIAIDRREPFRIQTTGPGNTIKVAEGLTAGPHTITICKDTESGIGYLEFLGFKCAGLLPMPPKPARKIEFIGDSITAGAGSDLSQTPCDKGQWYDQHNAYMSYGPLVARGLHAQWHLTAVAGIGLIHSCCNMGITMPQVFDKMNLRDNVGQWNFNRYHPDVVTICLGQNDGIQDAKTFCDAYVSFIEKVRSRYPQAEIICLTSPMANAELTAAMKGYLSQVVERMKKSGDRKVHAFFFSRSYNQGCGGHPDVAQHQLIAKELAAYLKTELNW